MQVNINEDYTRLSSFEIHTINLLRENSVDGWFGEMEGIHLQRALDVVKDLDGAVVELGSYMGRSSCFLGLKCKDNVEKLLCIDTFTGSEEHQEFLKQYGGSTLQIFKNNIKKLNLEKAVNYIESKSVAAADKVKEPIKFIFIDADHSYEGVKADFEAYYPLVKVGGIIAMHDCGEYAPDGTLVNNFGWVGPTKLYHELKRNENLKLLTTRIDGSAGSARVFLKLA